MRTNLSSAAFSSLSALASSALYSSSFGRSGLLVGAALSFEVVGVGDFACSAVEAMLESGRSSM